jgi:hypothetical protein
MKTTRLISQDKGIHRSKAQPLGPVADLALFRRQIASMNKRQLRALYTRLTRKLADKKGAKK